MISASTVILILIADKTCAVWPLAYCSITSAYSCTQVLVSFKTVLITVGTLKIDIAPKIG